MDDDFLKLTNIIQEAVVVINSRAEINTCNPAFNEFSGLSCHHLRGHSPCKLLDTKGSLQLEEWLEQLSERHVLKPESLHIKNHLNSYQQYLIRPIIWNFEEESLLILLFDPHSSIADEISTPAAQSLIDSFNAQRIQIHILEQELSEDESSWKKEHPELMHILQDVDSTLAQLNQSLSNSDQHIDMRSSIVEVMKLTTDYWKESTRLNKADLARKSGLWKVYTNEDGWDRTQTLDRYLHLETLPKYPRRKQVIRTAEFTLSHTNIQNQTRDALVKSLVNLRMKN